MGVRVSQNLVRLHHSIYATEPEKVLHRRTTCTRGFNIALSIKVKVVGPSSVLESLVR